VLGAAEGLLVALLVVLGATFIMGREHPSIDGSHSVAVYDTVRSYLAEKTQSLPAPSEWL